MSNLHMIAHACMFPEWRGVDKRRILRVARMLLRHTLTQKRLNFLITLR